MRRGTKVQKIIAPWIEAFADLRISKWKLLDSEFASDLKKLGATAVETDEKTRDRYGVSAGSEEELHEVLEDILRDDQLANVICSEWGKIRFSLSGALRLELPWTRKWFSAALGRLYDLLGCVEGDISRLRIESKPGETADPAQSDSKTRQGITITKTGQVWVSSYGYDPENDREYTIESDRFHVSANDAKKILKAFADTFRRPKRPAHVTDSNLWTVEIDASCEKYNYSGSIVPYTIPEAVELSSLVREVLNRPDLPVLDGKLNERFVDRVDLMFTRALHIAAHAEAEPKSPKVFYQEHITVDRSLGTVHMTIGTGEKSRISCHLEVPDAVGNLLDSLDPNTLPEIKTTDVKNDAETGDDYPSYTFAAEISDGSLYMIQGPCRPYEFPGQFVSFAQVVGALMDHYGSSELLGTVERYHKTFRSDDVICCYVDVEDYFHPCVYKTDDPTIRRGDYVRVPNAVNGGTAIGVVASIERLPDDETLRLLNDAMWILSKVSHP